ncbi:hypothetical protein [Kutzneria buriramensis]|uniref:Putative metal-dependent peptidase n=1 Tax=Kutzneria buriramensis TaxID=1045776 RepID=A0A3E0HL15_9PSEU|nr:hypothetical protein [Kutzneria buriramensis]REH47058.1 putative metal-dependent peptidase [Kutzneria buriramensis]
MKEEHKAIKDGWAIVRGHVVLASLATRVSLDLSGSLGGGWAVVDNDGRIRVNTAMSGEPVEWAWAFAHLLLHLGLGHIEGIADRVHDAACCVAVNRFSDVVRVGRPPIWLPEMPGGDEESLIERWRLTGVPPALLHCGTGGSGTCMYFVAGGRKPSYWTDLFAQGLVDAANASLEDAASSSGQALRRQHVWDRALSWFVSSYPLLGAVAAGLTLVDDPEISRAYGIRIAAVSATHGEVYINPHARLSPEEWRFVLAHEMLHAALRHDLRVDGRDHYLWNVACDYVVNGWLVDMGVGHIPEGALHDQRLAGLSAESVYDTLVTDLRRGRKLLTLGGVSSGDVLGDWLSEPSSVARRGSQRLPWDRPDRVGAVDLEDFYRRALTTGLEYHRQGRGLVPAGLEEEIRALAHPPLPWDVRLARWFDEHVPSLVPVRSYSRLSRRQAASPSIPRPGYFRPFSEVPRHTFGVVLDTSGTMSPALLGKALGAIASYAASRDVPAARVVFCDAAAYDAGYLPAAALSSRLRVRGRGGTVLQPGVTLLERAPDFPPDAPILIITDAACDVLRVRRPHAYLIPASARLPFPARGPVFPLT